MKTLCIFLALALSAECYSQTLPEEEQRKVYNTLQTIKSYVQPWDTARITRIKSDSTKQVRILCKSSAGTTAEPLLFVDGIAKEMSCLKQITPADIQSVNVLKGEAALKKYGNKALHGVIEVELKHPDNTSL